MQEFDPREENPGVARAIGEIVDRTTLIVHDEIELAKAEVMAALQDLVRGSVAGILGGIFAVFGFVIFLQAGALFLNDLFNWNAYPWLGYLTVALILFILGGIAAWVALRKIKKGSQLTPGMAIEEARKTQEALRPPEPAESAVVPKAASAPAAATPTSPAPAVPTPATPAPATPAQPEPPAPVPAVATPPQPAPPADDKAARKAAKQAERDAAKAAKEQTKADRAAAKDLQRAEQAAEKARQQAAKQQQAQDKLQAKQQAKARKQAEKAAKKGGEQPKPPPQQSGGQVQQPPPQQQQQPPQPQPPAGDQPTDQGQ